jgi:hypothetical protein
MKERPAIPPIQIITDNTWMNFRMPYALTIAAAPFGWLTGTLIEYFKKFNY